MINPKFMGWYYTVDGKPVGPLSTEEVQHFFDGSKRLPLDEVCSAWQGGDRIKLLRVHETHRRVVVVDDDRDTADTLAQLLCLWGHEATAAYDGPTALRTADAARPDVMLVDLAMPQMDGLRLAQEVRRRAGDHTLLIAMSGYGDEIDQRHCARAGYDVYLLKPLDLPALHALLMLPSIRADGICEAAAAPAARP